jgi:hypothetical protein
LITMELAVTLAPPPTEAAIVTIPVPPSVARAPNGESTLSDRWRMAGLQSSTRMGHTATHLVGLGQARASLGIRP